MHQRILTFLSTIIIALVLSQPVAADTAAAASARIKERLEQVDQMKSSGEAGEDANGYLSTRKPLGPRQEALVDAENADRRILYAAVAGRTGQTVEEVGRQRAIRIAELATAGVWLQRPDGEWYRK
jgi:uncharacterized protein YdbL (DUF1318 family)